MKIVLTGGGSGGHTTPLIAVGKALKAAYKDDVRLVVIAEKSLKEEPILRRTKTYRIHAGKFRRYHNHGFWKQLKDIETVWENIKDSVRVVRGFVQSVRILLKEKPDVIFIKGGYVSLPVGYAARLLNIAYVTHDSDVQPGLTNRLLAKGATKNLVGFPKDQYVYDPLKAMHVGIPVRESFSGITKSGAREMLGVPLHQKRLLIVGGSLGAKRVNDAVIEVLDDLTKLASVYHISGPGEYDRVYGATQELRKQSKVFEKKYTLKAYEKEHMAEELAAADIVITRAGATVLAEAAALKKPLIVVPNPYLAEGHQLKNARILNEYDAAEIIDEQELVKNPELITSAVKKLLSDHQQRSWMSSNLSDVFKDEAAESIAAILYEIGAKN